MEDSDGENHSWGLNEEITHRYTDLYSSDVEVDLTVQQRVIWMVICLSKWMVNW